MTFLSNPSLRRRSTRSGFTPYTSCRKISAGRDARKLSESVEVESKGTGEEQGELGGVIGGRCRGRGSLKGAGTFWAEMPFSNRSLAKPAGGTVVRRGGNESPRVNLHGVTGVEGTERRELGVEAQLREEKRREERKKS